VPRVRRSDRNEKEENNMGNPVVHFEVSGEDPKKLRAYYAELFGWEFDTDSPVAPSVSEAGNYGFLNSEVGIPGGVGGGTGFPSHAIFYVGVDDVEAALAHAKNLGGTPVLGPEQNPSGKLVVAQFRDPEGNLIGLAGPK
jgi:predicted enzyme related to lactoylglutathione lyase